MLCHCEVVGDKTSCNINLLAPEFYI